MEHWAKKVSRKNYPKTCSIHVWTLLGTILIIFGILQNFWFFKNISKTRHSLEHWTKKFFKKITPKHVQNTFGQTGNDFGRFLNFENFLKHFEDSTLLGTLGKKNFSKKLPQNMFKTRFDTFGNDFGNFWNFSIFLIFWNHFKDSTLHGTLGKKIFEKFTPKYVRNIFRHFWERFRAFLEFWEIFDFLKTFRRLDTPWNAGQKNFSKKLPQRMFKTRLDKLGTILGVFWILKIF